MSYVRFPQPCSCFFQSKRPKQKCSESPENGTNQLDIVKCGANLVSDQKVGFSQNNSSPILSTFYSVQPQLLWILIGLCSQLAVPLLHRKPNLSYNLGYNPPKRNRGYNLGYNPCFITLGYNPWVVSYLLIKWGYNLGYNFRVIVAVITWVITPVAFWWVITQVITQVGFAVY